MTQSSVPGRLARRARDSWPARVAVAVGVVVVVVAIPTGIWMPADRWSALGQWIGAAGTVLAVAVALHIAHREAVAQAERDRADQRAREVEQARDAERERAVQAEREIQQARLITAELIEAELWEPVFEEETSPHRVKISNHSGSLVLHPRVEGFVHSGGGQITWDVVTEGPGWEYPGAVTTLAAGESRSEPVSFTLDPEFTEANVGTIEPVVGYTDAAGHRWRRTGSAGPVRVLPGDTPEIGGPTWYRLAPDL